MPSAPAPLADPADLTSAVPPPVPPPVSHAVPHNVPLALSSFVGRARERDAVAAALAGARLVTITGAGGAGKTRLAREVAAAAVAAAERGGAAGAGGSTGGVWWLELASVADGAQVPQAAAAVLGVRAGAGRDVTDAVAEALHAAAHAPAGASRRTLLVLDNCEHVVEAAAAFAERLLRAVPGLAVLATSREALAVEGEAAWVLPPLGTPPTAAPAGAPAGAPGQAGATAEALLAYDAVRLFVERARAAQPAFALTDANAAAVAAVTARLDGLPLALELAAVAVATLGVEQLAARLDDVFALLTRGRRTALPRHRTLRALLDWSHALLAGDERTLLARLAVFRGGFTLDAAEAVCGDGAPAPPDAPDVGPPDALPRAAVANALGRLVEHSLVDVREAHGETRYRLLETVRQYGLARLAERPGAERRARARHAAWVAAFTAAAEPAMWSAARGRTIRRLERDVDEIRAALDWAAAHDAMEGMRVAGALAWFWFSAVPWDEARALCDRALAAVDAEGVPDAERAPADQAALAAFGYGAAGLAYFAGDADGILAHITRALQLWDLVDAARAADPAVDARLREAAVRGRAVANQTAGLAHVFRGDFGPALRAMDAAVDLSRDGGHAWMHAVMLMRRALAAAAAGRLGQAMADYGASVPRLQALGETWFLSLALEGMAAVELARGDLPAAAAHARASVAALRDEPDAWFASRALDTLAAVAMVPPAGAAAPAPARVATAARLMGAAAALRAQCGAEVIGHDRERHAATAAAARAAAGDAAFDAARAEGAGLDLAGAFALAAAADVAPAPSAAAGAPPARVFTDRPVDRPVARDPAAAGAPEPARPVAGAPNALDAAPALAVDALGPLAVARRGVPLAPGELPAGNVTELLLLLVARPEGVTREQAGLALWPDASPARVRNTFHVTLHHLRRALGAGDEGAPGWVAFAEGRYRLAREAGPGAALDCDADAVRAAAERLRRAEAERAPLGEAALADAEAALGRARGPFGDGVAAGDWLLEQQDAFRTLWADGTHALARQHARAGRHARAADVLAALVAREPLRESAHRELMVLWAAGGDRARALGHYADLAARLGREVGAAPARETRTVAEQIRAAG